MADELRLLLDRFEGKQLIHERSFVLEDLMRWLEEKILTQVNNNSKEFLIEVDRLHTLHMTQFDKYAHERLIVQRSLVSTGMLLFAVSCRLELHQHEPSWRDTHTHLRLQDIAPQWIKDDFLEESPHPLLFMDVASILKVVHTIQRHWRSRHFNAGLLEQVLKWCERRLSLLITYPFDVETFNIERYRQKHGNDYLGNLALVFDSYALLSSMYRDLHRFHQYKDMLVEAAELDETKAIAWMENLMDKTQGDSLVIQYQMTYTELEVRLGEDLIFARRRTEVMRPGPMDVITECQGIDRAKVVHKDADVRLLEVYKEPARHESMWLVCVDYYFGQKQTFPWMKECVVMHLERARPYATLLDAEFPILVKVPTMNYYGVLVNKVIHVSKTPLQAILTWMTLLKEKHAGIYKFQGKRYFFEDILNEFI